MSENHFGDAEWGLQQLFADMRRVRNPFVQPHQQAQPLSVPISVPPVVQVPQMMTQPAPVIYNVYNNSSNQNPSTPQMVSQPMVKKSLSRTLIKVGIFVGVIIVTYYVIQDPKFIIQWGTNVISKLLGFY